MEFNEFALKLGCDTSELIVIGRMFGVASNTVWNWKSRNSVPAKYVLEARDRKLFKRKQPERKAG